MEQLKIILKQIAKGKIAPEEAHNLLLKNSFTELGFANVDWGRSLRCGAPEVIFCKGKRLEEIKKIALSLSEDGQVIATKASGEIGEELKKIFPRGNYHKKAGMFVSNPPALNNESARVAVMTAGTSDIPVAEEAAVTLSAFGINAETFYDVGVAGIHRILSKIDSIAKADVLIVVAGMDGVLPSIVSGLVSKPIIAVPTSVGYGANFEGLSALLTMLNSCAPGVAVMNIDNGFGAGYFAASILRSLGGAG
jgi:hypothetical protein